MWLYDCNRLAKLSDGYVAGIIPGVPWILLRFFTIRPSLTTKVQQFCFTRGDSDVKVFS